MLIVRNTFVAKPGSASTLAKLMKETVSASGILRQYRVLTDVTGDFNRVVLEFEVANLGEFEESMRNYATNETIRARMKEYLDLYVTGSREILTVV